MSLFLSLLDNKHMDFHQSDAIRNFSFKFLSKECTYERTTTREHIIIIRTKHHEKTNLIILSLRTSLEETFAHHR